MLAALPSGRRCRRRRRRSLWLCAGRSRGASRRCWRPSAMPSARLARSWAPPAAGGGGEATERAFSCDPRAGREQARTIVARQRVNSGVQAARAARSRDQALVRSSVAACTWRRHRSSPRILRDCPLRSAARSNAACPCPAVERCLRLGRHLSTLSLRHLSLQ